MYLMFVSFLQGTTKFSFSTIGAIQDKADLKDEDLAFVAGATGRVGSRTVRSYFSSGSFWNLDSESELVLELLRKQKPLFKYELISHNCDSLLFPVILMY